MADPGTGVDSTLRPLIDDLVKSSKLPTKRRGGSSNEKQTVAQLTSLAYEHGINSADLDVLLAEVITAGGPGRLDQASLAAIVRNLYPASRVSSEAVLAVVGCLGHGELRPSLVIQAMLLRWLILVHHVLESRDVLARAYGVLFNLLDTAAIRPQLCHLLALITRRKHVRPYRIQAILSLSRQIGNDPGLKGLLRVYKDYYPEIIVGEAAKGRAAPFKHPDSQWRERLDEIQEARLLATRHEGGSFQRSFRVVVQNSYALDSRKGSLLPPVRTLHAQESSVTLEEIENVDRFVQAIEKIELPNQLVACLADPLLQKLMQLRPDESNYRRVSAWIVAFGQDVLNGEVGESHLLEMLAIMKEYVSRMKLLPHAFLDFLKELMKTRHLGPERDLVLDIFSSVEPGPFEDLYSAVFQPMERAVLDNTPDSQLSLLRFYTTLLRNWTISLSAADKPPAYAASSLTGLIDHTWRLALTVAQSSPSASTDAYILDFYAQTHVLHSNPAISQYSRVVVPPAQLVYIIFFKQSLANISRLCATLAEYKRVFEGSLSRKQYERDLLNQFNGFLMDICNCIWRARAFNSTDPNASGCLMAQPVVERLTRYVAGLDPGFSLSSVFSLSFSPPLCLQSISALRELEDAAVLEDAEDQEAGITNRHAGPVTPDSLARLGANGGLQLSWQDYRLAVLTYLEAEGAVGIPELMYNTMKILMSARNSSNS